MEKLWLSLSAAGGWLFMHLIAFTMPIMPRTLIMHAFLVDLALMFDVRSLIFGVMAAGGVKFKTKDIKGS